MKNRIAYFSAFGLLISALGCSNSAVVEVDDETEHLDELVSLAKRYVNEHSVLIVGNAASSFQDVANASGETSRNVPYVQLTGDHARDYIFGSVLGKTNDEPYSCELEAGSGIFAQRDFAECVFDLLNRGMCVYGEMDKEGNIYFGPTACKE